VRQHIRSILFFEIIFGILCSLVSFVIFAKIADEVLEKDGASIDAFVSQAIYAIRHPMLTDVMMGISWIGNEGIIVATIILTILLLANKHSNTAFLFAFTIFTGYIINGFAKQLLAIPRPTIDPLYIENFYSFPSGHAMGSFIFFAMVTYLVFILTRSFMYTIISAILCGLMVMAVGFSRVYLGVHFPSDIAAGYIAGFWWVVTVIVFDRLVRFYHLYRRN
jgi:membrane-associated phospholipid phosphatase